MAWARVGAAMASSAMEVIRFIEIPVVGYHPDTIDGRGGACDQLRLAGWMVTLSPQPQASVSLGLWKTNLAESLLTS